MPWEYITLHNSPNNNYNNNARRSNARRNNARRNNARRNNAINQNLRNIQLSKKKSNFQRTRNVLNEWRREFHPTANPPLGVILTLSGIYPAAAVAAAARNAGGLAVRRAQSRWKRARNGKK